MKIILKTNLGIFNIVPDSLQDLEIYRMNRKRISFTIPDHIKEITSITFIEGKNETSIENPSILLPPNKEGIKRSIEISIGVLETRIDNERPKF